MSKNALQVTKQKLSHGRIFMGQNISLYGKLDKTTNEKRVYP